MNCSNCKNNTNINNLTLLYFTTLTTFATNIIEACKNPKQDMQPSESGNESFGARKELGIPMLLSLRYIG